MRKDSRTRALTEVIAHTTYANDDVISSKEPYRDGIVENEAVLERREGPIEHMKEELFVERRRSTPIRLDVLHVPGTLMTLQGTDGLSRGTWTLSRHHPQPRRDLIKRNLNS